MPGTLFIVPTPIGNLDDITLRAIRILGEVDMIAAEDTRHSGQLLAHLKIKKPFISYQEHNEARRIPEIIQRLAEGQNIALISDAGTPALSDPGFKLVREVMAQQLPIDVLPGASAILVALVGSGLPTDRFYFGGFLPRTSIKRQKAFAELSMLSATLIFFESPHRVAATLADALAALGDRPAVVARELTKLHQQFDAGSLSTLSKKYTQTKGEIVLVIGGLTKKSMAEEE
jgi:16S rRNA (cytidine1402-2'-O)-methyltransferase